MFQVITGDETIDYDSEDVPAGIDDLANVLFVAPVKFQQSSHRDDTIGATTLD